MIGAKNSVRVFVKYRRLQRRLRGGTLTAWIRLMGGRVAGGLQAERGVLIRWRPHIGLDFGRGVYLGVGTILDVPPGARLSVGDGVKIMHYCVVASSRSIEIGAMTQVAEHCSIRDSDHGLELSRPIREQTLASPTKIGSDVWIGRGSAVLRGTSIGDGAVIGANSVARGQIPPLAIAVGAPARVIRMRAVTT
jgi:acetyltransferase-like isoleucine patch superfamily enzyme